jgi:hypothetical protein
LASFAPRHSVPTYLNVSYLDTPTGGALLTASVQVSTTRLSYGADGNQPAAIDLAGVVLNDMGKQVTGFKTRLSVKPLPANIEQSEQGSVIYNYKAPLAPGLYQVRTAARDERSAQVGSSHQWIEIPDLTNKKLTLSSLLVGGHLFEKGEKRDAAPAGASGGATTTPASASTAASSTPQVQFSVDKRFSRAGKLSFWVFIYNAMRGAGGQPDLAVQVQVYRGAQSIVSTPQRKLQTAGMDDLARIPYGGEFALSSLQPGRYMLQVSVTDKAANTTAIQRSFFDVE